MKSQDKIFAVIDTNVIVSSFFSKGGTSNPSLLIKAIFQDKIIPVFNEDIINEYRNVLYRTKFNFSSQLIENLVETIVELGLRIEEGKPADEYFPDSKDVVFYEVKMAVEGSYLVTGNIKHFPIKPFVVTPAQMVEILREKSLLPSPNLLPKKHGKRQ